MNREIKFRAWCKYANGYVMDYDPYADEYSCEGTPINDLFTQKAQESLNQILMQYTGLKDKNGVEIYEGDILKWKCSKSGSKKERIYIVTIEWKDGSHGYSLTIHDKGEKWATQKSYWNASEREIVGNIHENPELLTPNGE